MVFRHFKIKRISPRTIQPVICLLLLCLTAIPTLGKEDNQDMDVFFMMSLEELLEQEVVTASLEPEPLSETITSTYIITAQQIQAMGARTIYDALAHVPGLTISGNKGGANKIFSRGMGSRFSAQFLILLDNHALNSPVAGDTMSGRFDRLAVNNIERIEVVQGPGSSVYGGNAFLAMINIITKKGNNIKGTEINASLEFDQNGQAAQRYSMLYGDEYANDWQFSINLNVLEGDGVERWVDQDALGQSGEADTSEENYDVTFNVSNKKFKLDGRYYTSKAGDGFGIAYILADNSNIENEHGFIDTTYEVISTPDLVVSMRGAAERWRSSHYYVISAPSSAIGYNSYQVDGDANVYSTELRSVFTGISQHQIISGITYRYEEVKNTSFWISDQFIPSNWMLPVDRNIWAIYLNDKYQISPNILATLGGRYDDYSDFGSSFNPRLGMSWQVSPRYKIKALYGTAFRAPDFASQYSTSNPLAQPNSDLDAEEITTWEFSLVSHLNPQLLIQATLFRSEVEGLIGTGAVGSIKWENTDSITSKGLELSFRYDVNEHFNISGNYTYAHLDHSENYQQPTVPEQSGSMNLNYQFNNYFTLNLNGYGQDKAPRETGDIRSDLSSYIILNSTITAIINAHVEAQFSVYNLTDKRYAYAAPANTLIDDYTAPSLSFLFGMKYTF